MKGNLAGDEGILDGLHPKHLPVQVDMSQILLFTILFLVVQTSQANINDTEIDKVNNLITSKTLHDKNVEEFNISGEANIGEEKINRTSREKRTLWKKGGGGGGCYSCQQAPIVVQPIIVIKKKFKKRFHGGGCGYGGCQPRPCHSCQQYRPPPPCYSCRPVCNTCGGYGKR